MQGRHYDKHGYDDEKRAALLAWENRLAEIKDGTAATNVRPLQRKA